ncbi:uncharacterized protein [Centruroides vittatus]|uniref:uncharacterized protein n=1 Tax=Centruroides vittatus TaxID=120091 RepID=UPI003510729E
MTTVTLFAMRKNRRVSSRPPKPPWWNSDCQRALASKRKSYHRYQRHINRDNWIQAKKATAELQRCIITQKRAFWECMASSPHYKNNIWSILRRLRNNNNSPSSHFILRHDNCTLITPKDQAAKFLNFFIPELRDQQPIISRPNNTTYQQDPYNLPFTNRELDISIKKGRNTTPGADGIMTNMLKGFDYQTKSHLLAVYNTIWSTGNIPPKMKNTIILPIHKHGRHKSNGQGYLSHSSTQCLGIPQGSVISPFLFAIFMNDIFHLENENTKIYVYSDDVTAVTHGTDPIHLHYNTVQFLNNFGRWAHKNSVQCQPRKCAIMRIPINIRGNQVFILNNQPIPEVSKIKLLGVYITARLTWNAHIQYIRDKSRKLLNIFKIYCNKKHGGQPKDLLCIANSTIGSLLMYVIPSIATITKTQMAILESLQIQFIKLSYGLPMTANNILTRRATNTTTIECRYRKYLIKHYSSYLQKAPRDNFSRKIIHLIHSNEGATLVKSPITHYIWNWTNMHNIPINKHPAQNSILPDATVFDIHIGDLPFQDSSLPNPVIQSTFHEWATAQDPSTFLATDGFKTDTNVTAAFTDYSNSIKAHYTLHSEATIFTAESFAILCALQHATENNSNITVCTDSQAILTAINAYQDKSSSIIYTIINHNSRNKGNLRTRLVWTPAHKGITLNEQANKLAKSLPNDTKKTRYITPKDYISIINTDIKKQIDTDWHNFPSHSDYHWLTIGRHIPVMD